MPTLPAATAPVFLVGVSPAVVQAGSSALSLTLSATGVAAGAVVLVDGFRHDATLVSSTNVTVPLTSGELATGTRHRLTIQNPGFTPSNAKTVLVTQGYLAFGDSITFGGTLTTSATGNYAYLLASAYHLGFVNGAISGDQACDVWPQMFRSRAGYDSAAAPLFSLMIGTNDVDNKGTGAYESIFTACDLAALSWLGTPRTTKVLAGDTALTASGACTNAVSTAALGAIDCSGTSGTITTTLTTTGNPVYVWYLLSDRAAFGDGIDITLDGTASGTFTTQPIVPIASQNGSAQGIAVARIAALAGTHTVRVRTNGMAGVLGIGSNPSTGSDRPRLLVGDLPNQAKDGPVASVTSQLAYLAHIVEIEQSLISDGMDVHRALTRDFMLGTVFEMNDQLHPNPVGQAELEAAFDAALP